MNTQILTAFILTLMPLGLWAESISLKVTSERGLALNGSVQVGAKSYTLKEGLAKLEAGEQSHLMISISVPGYYDSVQTLAVSEWSQGLPPVTLVEKKPGRLMHAFAGDAMISRRYLKPLPGDKRLIDPDNQLPGMKRLLQWTKPYLSIADMASVNLETQLFRDESPEPLAKSVVFHTDPDVLIALEDAGVDYVALGNNHSYDYGEEGLRLTLDALSKSKLAYSGAGHTDTEARAPAELNGWSLLSYVGWTGSAKADQVARAHKGGAAWANEQDLREDILGLGDKPSLVQIHSGLEYRDQPSMMERTRFKAAIDAGADLVIGHHPHVLQGLELVNERLIAYSLGNFVFDQYIYSTQLSMLLYVWMDGDQFHRAEIVPIYLNGYVPAPATGDIRYDILQRMLHLSDLEHLGFQASGAHAAINKLPDRTLHQHLDVTHSTPIPISLRQLGADPLALIKQVNTDAAFMRLGVDLIKRGSFDHWGEYGTHAQSWIVSDNIQRLPGDDPRLEIKGSVTTGLRTFERAFLASNPATVSAEIESECEAEVRFLLQRRSLSESRTKALESGEILLLGTSNLKAGDSLKVHHEFDTPRNFTKGIRLLIDIDQQESCRTTIDDLVLIEWRTPWLETNSPIADSESIQSTHLQLAAQVKP